MKKRNFIFDLFNWILLALPLIFVIGTLVYTQSNENAKDSYYGETINQSEDIFAHNDYIVGKRYNLNIGNVPYTSSQSEVVFSVSDVIANFSVDISSCNIIRIRTQNGATYCLFYNGSTYLNDWNFSTSSVRSISFIYVSDNGVDLLPQYDLIYYIEYNNYSFLNNALPYAMDQFNQVGFNKIDFVHFFTDLFIDSSSLNNVYVTFINSYMNYILFTELAVFIPSVFLWIIHLFKHLGMDFMGRKEN